MLYLIGLGLGDEKDITVKGLEIIKQKCEKVYLENYTSILSEPDSGESEERDENESQRKRMELFYGKRCEICDRDFVEQNGVEKMLEEAKEKDIAFLVVGDCFAATTHADLVLRASDRGVNVKVIYNASIMNACAGSGLQLYNFGKTVSLCFFTNGWRPDSFYDGIKGNRDLGLHTLILLDIRVKEPTVEALCSGKKIYEPRRFMTVCTAAKQMLAVERDRKERVYDENTRAIAIARVGQDDERFITCSLKEMCSPNCGKPLHSLILVGAKTHELEEKMLKFYEAKKEDFYESDDLVPNQYLEDFDL